MRDLEWRKGKRSAAHAEDPEVRAPTIVGLDPGNNASLDSSDVITHPILSIVKENRLEMSPTRAWERWCAWAGAVYRASSGRKAASSAVGRASTFSTRVAAGSCRRSLPGCCAAPSPVLWGRKRRRIRYNELLPVYWRRGAGQSPLRPFVVAPTPYRKRKSSRLYYRQPLYLLSARRGPPSTLCNRHTAGDTVPG
jgi:hypothetical protein